MATKMDILTDEYNKAAARAAALNDQIAGLWGTPCGIRCSGCGEMLETEGDFAAHFVLPASSILNNHLNLGECPHTSRGQSILRHTSKFTASLI